MFKKFINPSKNLSDFIPSKKIRELTEEQLLKINGGGSTAMTSADQQAVAIAYQNGNYAEAQNIINKYMGNEGSNSGNEGNTTSGTSQTPTNGGLNNNTGGSDSGIQNTSNNGQQGGGYSGAVYQDSYTPPPPPAYYSRACDAVLLAEIRGKQVIDYKEETNLMNTTTSLILVTQDKVGEDLNLPKNKTCLVTDWVNAYISEGLTYNKCIDVLKKEIENGNIRSTDAYMEDQLSTSKALAKELKGDNFDGKYLQYPWKQGAQVEFSSQQLFNESSYDYGIGQFSSSLSNEYHYEFFSKNGKFDPYPNSVESCSNWEKNSLDFIKPLGWYK